MSNRTKPRVHYATFINEDTGEVIPLYLHSREAIDAEIDQRIRQDRALGLDCTEHEATRARFHATIDRQLAVVRTLVSA